MELLSAPTILICMFMAMSAAAVAMGIVWFHNRQERAAGYWALGFLLGACSGITVALRTLVIDYVHYTIIAHSILVICAYMLVLGGFRAFNGQTVSHVAILAVPVLWLGAFLIWQPLRDDANTGIAVLSTIIAAVSLLSAFTVYTGPGNRSLPMALPVTIFLTSHAVFQLGHVGFAIFDPSPIVNGRVVAGWWRVLMLEAFLHTILTGISCVILIKDRSEQQHRLASETDALTGVANRRAFVKRTEAELETAGNEAILAIIDIDHFKQINDQFGHQAGDTALIAFAELIADNIPAGAKFGRIGGEEFGLYLPDTVAFPHDILNDLRLTVEISPVLHQDTQIMMTASIGVASVERAGRDFDTLSAAADSALYIAKKSGRNRVVSFSLTQKLHHFMEHDGGQSSDQTRSRVNGHIVGSVA